MTFNIMSTNRSKYSFEVNGVVLNPNALVLQPYTWALVDYGLVNKVTSDYITSITIRFKGDVAADTLSLFEINLV
ncbi:hypothetical protein DFA_08518 [Cavenderia fasciculata]|uniref:Uncharacterized protein n=1 Tax=Cavenderia fasciculata TaxID=261658 RepID=F4Q2Q5_CACFS|nr:uncharacterized protein DFA_08518 [Cavenderia fasciculata]EGG17522.1 hypothetical protein DFA_08518 [Cavenderia fasciculata]|eukprot:XP_004356006.1 hypothetical protein DFA_08518 [Cavenderia fasciculata]